MYNFYYYSGLISLLEYKAIKYFFFALLIIPNLIDVHDSYIILMSFSLKNDIFFIFYLQPLLFYMPCVSVVRYFRLKTQYMYVVSICVQTNIYNKMCSNRTKRKTQRSHLSPGPKIISKQYLEVKHEIYGELGTINLV